MAGRIVGLRTQSEHYHRGRVLGVAERAIEADPTHGIVCNRGMAWASIEPVLAYLSNYANPWRSRDIVALSYRLTGRLPGCTRHRQVVLDQVDRERHELVALLAVEPSLKRDSVLVPTIKGCDIGNPKVVSVLSDRHLCILAQDAQVRKEKVNAGDLRFLDVQHAPNFVSAMTSLRSSLPGTVNEKLTAVSGM